MESKVKAIKAGSVIALLSLVSFTIIGLVMKESNLKNILFTVFSGIFTSSFVTIFIYATEYRVVKKEAMEDYWNCCHKVNQMIMQIPFLVFDEPDELVKEYIAEISHNEGVQDLLQQLPKDYDTTEWSDTLKICTEAEDKMIEYIRQRHNYLSVGQEDQDTSVRASLKEKMHKYEEKINSVLEIYMKIADISYESVENAYGKMYFFRSQQFRIKTYNQIHEPLRELLKKIKVRAYGNFKPHLEKEYYNIPVMIEFISELQKDIFEIEYVCVDEEKGYHLVKSVKNQYYFKMDKLIEDFRTQIYHCKPEYQKEFCSFSRWI